MGHTDREKPDPPTGDYEDWLNSTGCGDENESDTTHPAIQGPGQDSLGQNGDGSIPE